MNLTDKEVRRALQSLLRVAGPGGLEEVEIERRFEQLSPRLVELKLQAILWHLFETGQVDASVNGDGELAWYPTPESGGNPVRIPS